MEPHSKAETIIIFTLWILTVGALFCILLMIP